MSHLFIITSPRPPGELGFAFPFTFVFVFYINLNTVIYITLQTREKSVCLFLCSLISTLVYSSQPTTDTFTMSNPAIEKYGWTAVPRKVSTLLEQSEASGDAPAILVSSIPLPSSSLSNAVREHAQRELPVETFNHSMRVFYYGSAILQHAFPSWLSPSFIETYFLSAMLHDIGTTNTNIRATLMSFEFYGGLLSLDLLRSLGAPKEQAENVAETVIRHQDLGDEGTVTRIEAVIQLATIFDNMGGQPQLVSKATIESVTKAYPRKKWSSCFAATIRRENTLKPWAHTTALGERAFPEGVEGNALMAPYDNLE
jgi:cyanamide hydratase